MELESVTLEDLARSPRKKAYELVEFAYPVARTVLFNVEKWDAWRSGGTLLAALKGYLECSPDDQGAPGSLVPRINIGQAKVGAVRFDIEGCYHAPASARNGGRSGSQVRVSRTLVMGRRFTTRPHREPAV